jgi:multiple antibiotic resistance protein
MARAIEAFLLAMPTLFSIVNPIDGAFAFQMLTADSTAAEREALARNVALISVLVMLVALWGGFIY